MSLFNISLSTGILGLFIALPLILSRRTRPANVWLGLFVFSIAWLSLADLYFAYPEYLFGVFDPPVAAVGAFFYCYVRSLTGLEVGRRQAWHFIPLAAWCSVLLAARIIVPPMTLFDWLRGPGDPVFGAILLGFQVLAIGYVVAVLRRLHQYRRQLRESYSSLKERDLVWLSTISVVVIILLTIWIPATQFAGRLGIVVLIVARLLTLVFLGWYGMHQYAVLLPQHVTPAPSDSPSNVAEPDVTPAQVPDTNDTDVETEKYARSGMTDAAQQLIGDRLARRMTQDRDYLDNDIKLTELAERVGTSPQLLSQYLNHVLGMSFFDYINGLRVAEVQRMMGEEKHAGTPLLDLAFAAGFNSKSTFNSAFKKITGMAPSAWRNEHVPASEPIG